MKAAVCRQFGEPWYIEDLRLDPPGPEEIGVKIKACAICHSDIHFGDGAWGGEPPFVFGHEASGIVTGVGSGRHGFQVGDHVVVTLIRSCGHCHYCDAGELVQCETDLSRPDGGPIWTESGDRVGQAMQTAAFAEEVTVHSSQAIAIPKDIPFESASLLACGVITGFGAATKSANVKPGQTVVVLGCGGVGLNAIQGARIAGARMIAAVDVQPGKLAIARKFGATEAIKSGAGDMAGAVKSLTGGRGADHVLVTVGIKGLMDQGVSLLARSGTMTVVGMPDSGVMAEYEPTSLAFYGQRIQGSIMGSAQIHRDIPMLIDLYKAGQLYLDELISNTYPLERINEAVAEVRAGQVLRNVIVFE